MIIVWLVLLTFNFKDAICVTFLLILYKQCTKCSFISKMKCIDRFTILSLFYFLTGCPVLRYDSNDLSSEVHCPLIRHWSLLVCLLIISVMKSRATKESLLNKLTLKHLHGALNLQTLTRNIKFTNINTEH